MLKRISLALVGLALMIDASTDLARSADWRSGYEQNTGCYANVAANDNGPAASDGNAHCVKPEFANGQSYYVAISGFAAYATPTDMVCIWGSATKTVYISSFFFGPQSTSGTQEVWYVVKRSTADAGGSPTTYTPVAYDSADVSATASVKSYGAAPTPGTAVGNLRVFQESTSALTSNLSAFTIDAFGNSPWSQLPSATSLRQPLTLHGTGEGVCINFNGAALPSAFTSYAGVEWTER